MTEELQSLRMEPADNGFKVCWTECERNESHGTYGNMTYKSREMVYKDSEKKQAMAKFMEIRNKIVGVEAEEEESEGE